MTPAKKAHFSEKYPTPSNIVLGRIGPVGVKYIKYEITYRAIVEKNDSKWPNFSSGVKEWSISATFSVISRTLLGILT